MSRIKKNQNFGMMLLFAIVVFAAMMVHMTISVGIVLALVKADVLIVADSADLHLGRLFAFMAMVSLPIGAVLAVIVSKIPLKPVRDLAAGMNRLAAGHFDTRIETGGVIRSYPAFVEVTESFNKLAQELESTEMLRGDFINNFSHEFKTPIVSIAGFAKLLKRGNLPQEQQREYLDAIEQESLRLSAMATNVLNLTRVENQTILTDVTEYNLSEQIRSCILLLESKWDKKDLELQLEFGEHSVRANEELLKQVWINLLDNAIKFAPEGHTVQVRMEENETGILVTVLNTGSEIAPEHRKKIFNKFYQADESHATQGNGVGLAIVKRIVELHGGKVSVNSQNEVTAFTVELPKQGKYPPDCS